MLMGGLNRKLVLLPYNSLVWFGLIFVSILSLAFAPGPALLGSFTIYKLIRVWILYWVIVNLCTDRENVQTIVAALIAIAVFQGCVVIWDKYIVKTVVSRSTGTLRHPNGLAVFMDTTLPIILVLLMNNLLTKKASRFAVAALVLGFMSVLFTKSRAGIVLLPVLLGGVVMFQVLSKPTFRKVAIAAAGTVLILAIGAMAMPKIIKRFESAPKESAETRIYFNNAAKEMANDNLFGCGVNLFPWTVGNTDYYWTVYPDHVDEADPEAFQESDIGKSRLGVVHHIYYLWAAETGWIGFSLFLLLILRFSWTNLRLWWSIKDPYYKNLLFGMLAGTSAMHVQGLLEYFLRANGGIYLYMALSGVLIGIKKQQGS